MKTGRVLVTLITSISVGLVVAGCPNNSSTSGTNTGSNLAAGAPTLGSSGLNTGRTGTGTGTGTGSSGSPVPRSGSSSFTIINVIAQPANASGASAGSGAPSPNDPPPTFILAFNATTTSTLNDVCQSGGGAAGSSGNFDPAKQCKCQYTWGLTNTSSSSVITRVVQTVPASVTPFEVQCPGPGVYNNPDELPDSTPIKIQLVPDIAQGNNSGFSTNVMIFTKQPISSTGDFRDVEGHSFQNVFHYSCYDVTLRNMTISHSFKQAATNPTTNQSIQALVANEFDLGTTDFSAQSYYYDFYVRGNEPGSISQGNSQFTCPMVNVNGTPSFFPMDSQFAVALQKSGSFPVGVVGRTTVAGQGQATAGAVIGFAALPNSDGTCPSFTDSTGKVRRTFRLRQYTAIYPLRFQGNGDIQDVSQPNNTIYLLDRPVDKLGEDPLKPITRLGPKPCPFSFKTSQFGQKCITDASLSGWNIDGVQIQGNPKCPIYPPVPQSTTTNQPGSSTNTIDPAKPDGTLVIRPYRAFLPHYIENATFLACGFQSTNPVDPQLVLSHDSGIFPGGPYDFYCAQYYPPPGSIIPSGGNFNKIPGDCDIAASAAAIKTDKSYSCFKTYDPNAIQAGTPAAGCCQICSGTDCSKQGGGKTANGRNAVFNPPMDSTIGTNPGQATRVLLRSIPNDPNGQGCFDPSEN